MKSRGLPIVQIGPTLNYFDRGVVDNQCYSNLRLSIGSSFEAF